MATEQNRISKKVYCKKAKILSEGISTQTLRELAVEALKKLPKAKQRKEPVSSSSNQFRLINNFAMVGNALCGVMLTYEKDANALALAEDDDAETYNIEQFAPPEKDGKRREFLEGFLYFAIHGNAVAIIQSKSLRSKDFEQHLYWLLKEASSNGKAPLVVLNDAISKNVKARIDKSHVKSFELGGPFVVAKDLDGNTIQSKKQSLGNVNLGGLGMDVVKALTSILPSSVRLKDALDENIELTLNIKYKRSIGRKGQDLLDKLAMILRNHDDTDSKIILNDGSIIAGDELKLTSIIKVSSLNGVLLPDSAFAELSNLLNELIKTGDIIAQR